jgi:Pyruvate kinase, barrel domain
MRCRSYTGKRCISAFAGWTAATRTRDKRKPRKRRASHTCLRRRRRTPAAAASTLTTDPAHREHGTPQRLFVNYAGLPRALHQGSRILLDDGNIELVVTAIDGTEVQCSIANSGESC